MSSRGTEMDFEIAINMMMRETINRKYLQAGPLTAS